jgi:hypothetical protein
MTEPMTGKPELRKPKSPISYISIFLTIFLVLMAINSAYRQNWFGFWVNVAAAIFNILSASFHYYAYRKINKTYKMLKSFETIINTPVMREEGHSVIITIVMPHKELLDKLAACIPKKKSNG